MERLERCSPGYRAAVLGARELPARRTRCGAVQFAAYGVSERIEDGRTVIRATIDEGQVVELRLPAGLGVYFTRTTPTGKPVRAGRPQADTPREGGAL